MTPIKMKALLAILLCMPATQLLATTFDQVPVEELTEAADFVGIVEVVAAHTISAGDVACGALYRGRVIKQFKGSPATEIEFGHYVGYEMGTEYLLFLSAPGHDFRARITTNSMSMAREIKRDQECRQPRKIGHRVMHDGVGALKIQFTKLFQYKDGIVVPTDYLKFPDSVPRQTADLGDLEDYSGDAWFRESDVVEYLELITAGAKSSGKMTRPKKGKP